MWRACVLVTVFALYGIGCSPGTEEHIKNGIAKCDNKDHKGAIEEFTRAIEADSKSDVAFYNRGLCRKHLGEFQSAISDFDKAIEINPKYGDAFFNRGFCKF
ncbi:hypothetical protein MASR2M39_31060 [Ignavibacteriales bacterium]